MAQVCSQCQASNDDNVAFCFRCGAQLDQHTETIIADFSSLQASQEEEKRKKLLVPALAGCAVILCLAIIIVAAVVYLGRDQTEEPSPATGDTPTVSIQEPPDTPGPELDAPSSEPPPTITPSPSPEPLPTDTPTEVPPTPNQYGLRVGIQVQVFTTEGDTLRMRDAPGTHGQITEYLAKGTLLMIVDGPETDAGGLTWWQVRTGDGLIGWCVEFADSIQTLVP